MEDLKMTVGAVKTNHTNIGDLAEFIREESVVNSFYVEGLVGIFICSFVVLAIIAVILYYVIPCKR